MKPTFALTTSALAIATLAASMSAPLEAQQRVQDFTLPPSGTPTPTPEAEGPANEAAGVEIAPRSIQRPTPTPAPTSTTLPPPTNTSTPAPVQSPTPTPTPSAERPTVAQSPAPTTIAPPSVDSSNEPESGNPEQASDSAIPSIALPTPEPMMPSATDVIAPSAEDSTLPDWWIWAAGLLAALLAIGAGAWAFTRRRAAAGPAPIEPPIVPSQSGGHTSAAPIRADRLKINIQVENIMRSVMMLTLKLNVELANRQDRALRDIRVSADLVSAKRDVPMEQQMAGDQTILGELGQADRIGPHQMGSLRGQLQLPLSEIEVFRQGQTPLCVPLLRVRVDAEGIEPQFHTFLIGLAALQPGGRLQPLPLSGPPGGFEGVQAKRLETTA